MEQRCGQRKKKGERAGCGEDSASSHRRAGERERMRRGREGGGGEKKKGKKETHSNLTKSQRVWEGGAGNARLYTEGRGLVTSQPAARAGRRGAAALRGGKRAEERGGRRGASRSGWGGATPRCRCLSPPPPAPRPRLLPALHRFPGGWRARCADVGGRGRREVTWTERGVARAPAARAPALTPEAGRGALGAGPGGRGAKRGPGPKLARRLHCLEPALPGRG